MNTVQGLQTALRLSTSEKIKDRTQGIELVREIFSNRENLNAFGETARKEGGAAWIAFYQCLFQTVVMEKKLVVKPGAASTADKRLADAISLIRWMAERTVHMISKKPFLVLFNHMTRLLVFSNQIFPPAALDYTKALRTLLSYPPHLESLDQTSWKILMNICWSAVLGDEVVIDDTAWEDGESVEDEEEVNGGMDIDGYSTQVGSSRRSGRSTISQINTELLTLVPILLSSSTAPLVPPLPSKDNLSASIERPGYTLLLKIHRFLNQYFTETSAHLSVFRSLNILLTELELNCRDDTLSAGLKLLPQLVSLWGTRNKALREQVLIAIRILLPFVTHKTLVESKHATGVRDTLEKLMDGLSRETINKWGIDALDIGVLRLKSSGSKRGPFELRCIGAGFDFNHEHAMTWAVLELYTDASLHLYESDSLSHPATPTRNGAPSKRRRTENYINSLISSARLGTVKNRLLALQVIIFLCDRHISKLHDEAQLEIRRTMLDLLDEDDEQLQSWAFVGLSILAKISHEYLQDDQMESKYSLDSPSSRLAQRKSEETDWKKVWSHAIRKSSNSNVCRAACHAAYTLLQVDKLDSAQAIKDIHSLLRNVDIQGPVFPYDSVCALLSIALEMAKSDVRLYSLGLENKVLSWLEKCGLTEGPRGTSRKEQQTPADIVRLLASIAGFRHHPLREITIDEVLPDAAIVDRILEETKTKPIRDFLLYGTFPKKPMKDGDTGQSTESYAQALSSESLAYLKGRGRRISIFLSSTLSALATDWESIKGAAVPAERIRRCVDLIVIALSFQATIQLNGSVPDSDCIHSAIRLLTAIQPTFLSNGYSIPAQHLIWRGLEPLVNSAVIQEDAWQLLIQPDTQSGIRQDLLPAYRYDTQMTSHVGDRNNVNESKAESGPGPSQTLGLPSQIPPSGSYNFPPTPITPVQSILNRPAPHRLVDQIWLLPTVSAAFKDIFSLCLQLVSNLNSSSAYTNGNSVPAPGDIDDDDFGEIRNVETDAMPLSKEAIECQRTSASLLNTAIALRLKGYMLVSNLQRPYKDPQLVNALLVTEGSRFLEIGKALCVAVNNRWLRLGGDAVELVMDALEEMLRSYAYSRDTGLLNLCLIFIRCSMPVWLDVDGLKSDVGERVIHLVCYFASRIDKGTITSWKVKMGMLRFLEEFLHCDLAKDLWLQGMQDHVETDEEADNSDPLAYLSGSLLDVDARVRLRAVTSASSVFYRAILPLNRHFAFYFQVLNKQPGDDKHFDSFVSHTLWKLNCCIATAQQRSAAVFHLYEIPSITSAYNGHLQSGLKAVSSRLGLSSISELYLPCAIVIIRSQLLGNQLAMKIPHRLYGFPTRKAYSQACLQQVGPFMLAEGYIDFYTSACEASGICVEDSIDQAFASTAAIVYSKAFNPDTAAKQSVQDVMELLSNLPGGDTKKGLNKRLEASIDRIAAHLWELLDLQLSTNEIAVILNEMTSDQSAGSLYLELMTNDTLPIGNTAIDPFAAAQNIIAAYQYLRKQHSSLSTVKMVFNAIIRLTSRINDVFLVSEQRRSLRSLSLLVVLHPEEFQHPTILQAFLREMLAILPQPDICGIALSLVAWGFRQLNAFKGSISSLTDLFVQLGSARIALSETSQLGREVGDGLEDWIIQSARIWTDNENTKVAFQTALALWPETLRGKMTEPYSPFYTDLVNLSKSRTMKDAGELCKQYLRVIKTGTRPEAIETFVQSLFWHLKGKLMENSDMDGINAFLEILYLANGQIRVPPLDSMKLFSSYKNSNLTISSSKQIKDPEATLRSSIVQEVARLIDEPSHQTRSMAYRALQGMLPMIEDLVSSSFLPPNVLGQISALTPIHIPAQNGDDLALDECINQIAWIKHSRSADHWCRELVKILCQVVSTDDRFYQSLQPLLNSSTVSLRFLLPHLIQASLTCGASTHPEITLQRSKILSAHFSMVIQWPSASLGTIHSIIDTILHLRHFQPHYRNGELAYNAWLEIDYVLLSEAAVKCGAYATALLFLELAGDQEGKGFEEGDKRIQKIMYEIYSNVEDPDGFYGIQNHDVRDALLRRLEHEGQSQRAFGWNGAFIETASSNTSNTFLPALHNLHSFGFNRLASSMTHQTGQEGVDEDPFFFELAWRTGDWDLPMGEQLSRTPQGSLYSALRAVHRERNTQAALKIVNESIKVEVDRLSGLGMERMAQIKKTTTDLLCLREAAHWLDNDFQSSLENASNNAGGIAQVPVFANVDRSFDFTNAERLTATQLSLLDSGRQRESKNTLGDLLSPKAELLASLQKTCHLRLAEMAKNDDNIQASVNAITAVQQLEMGRTPSDEAQDAFSQVLWAQNEHGLAIQHARDLVHEAQSRKPANPGRLAVLYGRIAHWTDLAKLKAATEIKSIFDDAWKLAFHSKIPNAEQAKIYYEYACFADDHYTNLSKSSELERLKSYRERRAQESHILGSSKSSSRRESSSKPSKAAQEDEEDERAIKGLESELLAYIKMALRMYAQALALSDAHDDSITQLVSLWLQHDESEEINDSFKGTLNRIPSYKFVFLGPQLAARLYRPTTPTKFNANLNGLLLKMSKEHPYHILYQVITLAHGVSPPSSARRKSTDAENQGRGPAALEILNVLAGSKDTLAHQAAKQMKIFVVASVNWSRYEERSQSQSSSDNGGGSRKPKAGSQYNLPTNCPLKHLTNLRIPIATSSIPIDKSLAYMDIPTLERYGSTYMIAGGVHRPKIMRVYDTNKKQHQQLFKADDEVRQDAVMEQVFTKTNDLLTRDRQAKARNLRFRTYNVVPLPERTGIIEFVEGTRGIGEWLKPAHMKYRQGMDISPAEFQAKISKIQDRDPKSADLPKKYQECMTQFKPVLRHFFVEKHKDPMAWFTMRLNYARSVAVTSIVGWMVGLGDRHCSNILIDQVTGELVHIDFGIVFEDGRKLRIPEKVPFRLTNDIVDGLGISGIEGTFRRCSEHTLRVLRTSSSLILTVLEVFKNDPLYAWAGDPDKLQRAQGGLALPIGELIMHDANVKEKADRVLNKIKNKLGTGLSVEYTVNMLIQEARDVEHLARIYHGWAAWF
ncbi:hypothetical protein I203_100054 [Kwoniella mangroviensis CBS 8507]|uniref:uncharacterized protein n=1 Tax=Kwoniella mangroviensis CBS 8507 TaxID=1296122 RepID=UPI00080CE36E|nr:uncharacterized protein I203_07983 [Kwoniella mangroviensis CBS 8507]OCF63002.1 hypothetical protein I203_07983 [Kwoniella mangroviensis CBS 8507]